MCRFQLCALDHHFQSLKATLLAYLTPETLLTQTINREPHDGITNTLSKIITVAEYTYVQYL